MSNILRLITGFPNRTHEVIVAMEIVVAEKLFALLISNSVIHKNEVIAIFYQKAPHSPIAKIIFVGRIFLIPQDLGDNAKHGTAIQFEIAGIYHMKLQCNLLFSLRVQVQEFQLSLVAFPYIAL